MRWCRLWRWCAVVSVPVVAVVRCCGGVSCGGDALLWRCRLWRWCAVVAVVRCCGGDAL
ncbi:hypothetical protein DPMN_122653 [Dreissena polymorpha]|uniref:Secreted protein n=1 Tax=Dreissena polymorpha TaxID=45954 RepID=A0A9D4GSX9_DREPO|nr:hypothetical protein DPMN_122653 [Dreissena polymorpha]